MKPDRAREQPGMVSARGNSSTQGRIDAENKRHVYAVADIMRSREAELQRHVTVLQQAGSNAKLMADENKLHETHMQLLRTQPLERGVVGFRAAST